MRGARKGVLASTQDGLMISEMGPALEKQGLAKGRPLMSRPVWSTTTCLAMSLEETKSQGTWPRSPAPSSDGEGMPHFRAREGQESPGNSCFQSARMSTSLPNSPAERVRRVSAEDARRVRDAGDSTGHAAAPLWHKAGSGAGSEDSGSMGSGLARLEGWACGRRSQGGNRDRRMSLPVTDGEAQIYMHRDRVNLSLGLIEEIVEKLRSTHVDTQELSCPAPKARAMPTLRTAYAWVWPASSKPAQAAVPSPEKGSGGTECRFDDPTSPVMSPLGQVAPGGTSSTSFLRKTIPVGKQERRAWSSTQALYADAGAPRITSAPPRVRRRSVDLSAGIPPSPGESMKRRTRPAPAPARRQPSLLAPPPAVEPLKPAAEPVIGTQLSWVPSLVQALLWRQGVFEKIPARRRRLSSAEVPAPAPWGGAGGGVQWAKHLTSLLVLLYCSGFLLAAVNMTVGYERQGRGGLLMERAVGRGEGWRPAQESSELSPAGAAVGPLWGKDFVGALCDLCGPRRMLERFLEREL